MDLDKLAKLYKDMKISENSLPKIKLDSPLLSIGEEKIKLSLVGKILTTKPVNREGFIQNMHNIWSTKRGMTIESLGENRFILLFTMLEDKHRILIGGPWHYDNALLILEEPTGVGEISSLKFDRITLWAQIHNIPIMCMNGDTTLALGRRIGTIKELDLGPNGECLGKFIRVHVEIDVTKPLERFFFVELNGPKPVMIYIMYERLPSYGFDYGVLGHLKKECLHELLSKDYDPKNKAKYAD